MQLAEDSGVTSADFSGDPLRPRSWVEQRGELLRELSGRRVYRAVAGGRRVVVKEFSPVRWRRWLRNYAEAEAGRALAARARGVPVVEPLAWARLGDGRQLLVLREEPGARSLQEVFLERACTGAARHALARRVGELFAKLQNEGVRHDDPHAGNVLVRPDGSVLLADARNLRPTSGYLTHKQRAADLARFALFFLTHGNMVDLLLFWGAYGRASQLSPADLEELRHQVLQRVPGAFRRLSGSRSRRSRRHGRPVAFGAFTGIALAPEVSDETIETVVGLAGDLRPGDHVIKRSRTGWTFRVGDDYVAKVFLPKKATRSLRDLVLGTRAERAQRAAEALRHRGLRTPEVVAILRDGALASRSILVMRRVENARPLEEVLDRLPPAGARAAARKLGKTLRRMHDWGLRHRDLKRHNLLFSDDGLEVLFLDLDGVRQTCRGPLDWERRLKDLANLGGSLHDRRRVPLGLRLRLLDAYLDGETPPGFAPGEFARRLAAATRRSLERRAESWGLR